jgi:hypothetical protein
LHNKIELLYFIQILNVQNNLTMKHNLFLLLIALCFTGQFTSAQAPESFTWQAVVRDNANNLLTNQAVGVRAAIVADSATGTVAYREAHSVSTDDYGLINLALGEGTPDIGTFSGIDWSTGAYYVTIEIDPAGGTAYAPISNSQILSVPYALFAGNAGGAGGGSSISDTDGDTKIDVETNPDDDSIRFTIDGTERWIMTGNRLEPLANGESLYIGKNAGGNATPSMEENVFIGDKAGQSRSVGNNSTIIGVGAAILSSSAYGDCIVGYEAGKNNRGNYNCMFGYRSGSDNSTGTANSFFGASTGRLIKTGFGNSCFGFESGYNLEDTANYNTTFGAYSGQNSYGGRNTYIGGFSGWWGPDAKANAFLGYQTGQSNTGSWNTFLGHQAGFYNGAGKENVYVGHQAGGYNTTGDWNTFVGRQAGLYNTTGDANVYIGYRAGEFVETGYGNVHIGYNANGFGINDQVVNTINIGYYQTLNDNNEARIGNSFHTTIGGWSSWTTVSDGRFKKNVREDIEGLEFIKALRPVSYNMDLHAIEDFDAKNGRERKNANRTWEGKYDNEKNRHTGFIAQEVEAAANKTSFDFSGIKVPKNDASHYALRYSSFVVPLVKAVQEQQEMIEALQETVASKSEENDGLKQQINDLRADLDDIRKMLLSKGRAEK